jgi:hypothetical protein
MSAVPAEVLRRRCSFAQVICLEGIPLNSRLLPVSSFRRLVAGVALVAGFAAVSTPARADDGSGTTTIGGYTVSTTPTGSSDPNSYGKADDPNSYGKAGADTSGATSDSTDSYGKA